MSDAAITADAPARLVVQASDPVVREAAAAFGAARRLPVDFDGAADRAPSRWWTSRLVKWSASLSRVRSRPQLAVPRGARVAAFVHTAFWRAGRDDEAAERYVGPILDALRARIGDAIAYVGVGPRRLLREVLGEGGVHERERVGCIHGGHASRVGQRKDAAICWAP